MNRARQWVSAGFIQIQTPKTTALPCAGSKNVARRSSLGSGITLAWMLVECGVSLYAAAQARSLAMLAFGSDILIEVFSATVVILQFLPHFPLSQKRANRTAGLLLFALAGIVAAKYPKYDSTESTAGCCFPSDV